MPLTTPATLASVATWYNVKNYGALGDGTTNDSTAITAAATAAGANGTVYFPAGTYLCTNLTPLAGQTWRGAATLASKLLMTVGQTTNLVSVTVADVTLKNLELNGNRSNQTPVLNASLGGLINVTGARLTVQDCYLHDVANIAISAANADDLKVLNCRITNPNITTATAGYSYKGVYVGTGKRPIIKNCTLSGWSQAIGLWFGVTDAVVDSNYLLTNYGYEDAAHTVNRSALEDYGNNTDHGRNRILNNVIDGSTHNCIECAQGTVGSVFSGNILRNWGTPGGTANGVALEVTGQVADGTGFGPTNDILISGNYIYSLGTRQETGIVAGLYVARLKIENNSFFGFKGHANAYPISLQGDSPQVINGNTFSDCSRFVFVNENVDGGIITNNVGLNLTYVSGGAGIDFSTVGTGWLIEGNSFAGILAGGGPQILNIVAGSRHRIIGNRINNGSLGSSGASSVVIQATDCLIEGNSIAGGDAGNGGAIVLSGAAARNIVINNYLYANNTGRVALGLTGTADYNICQSNSIVNGTIFSSTSGTHNTTEPNHSATVTNAMTFKLLAANTVGVTQVSIAHGLGYIPTQLRITMTSAGTVWRSAVADITNVYVTADAAARTCDVYVR